MTFDEDNTYWLLRQQRENSWFAVKVRFVDGTPFISEVSVPHHDFHLVDDKFSLPISYAEFVDKQLFYVVNSSGDQRYAFENGWSIIFHNGATVELLKTTPTRNGEVVEVKPFANLPWEKALVGPEVNLRVNARNQMSIRRPESVSEDQVETHDDCACEEEIN